MPSTTDGSERRGGPRPTRRRFLGGVMALGWSLGASPVRAAAAGRLLIGFLPTGSNDLLLVAILRQLHDRYRPDLGPKVVAMPGNSGAMAREATANAEPDGATVLVSTSSSIALLPLTVPTAMTAVEALRPVVGIGRFCYAVIVGPGVPASVKTMADYLRWARVNPKEGYGIPQRGGVSHFVGTEIARMADVPLKVVAYKGTLPLLQDVANGHMAAGVTLLPTAQDLAENPTVRVLAVSSGERWPGYADVPTLLELRLAESSTVANLGVFVSTRVPEEKVAELRDAVDRVVRDASLRPAMDAAAVIPMPDATDYAAEIAGERTAWQERIARLKFSADR